MSEQDLRTMLSADDGRVDLIAEAKAAQAGDARPGAGAVKLIAPAKVNLFLNIGAKREDGYHEAATIMHALALHDVLHMEILAPAPSACGDAQAADAGCSAADRQGGSAGAAGELSAPEGIGAAAEAGGPFRAAPDASDAAESLPVEVVCRVCEGLAPLDVPPERNIVARAVRLLARRIAESSSLTARNARVEGVRIVLEKHIPAEAGLGGGSSDAAAALLGAAFLWGVPEDDPLIESAARELGADVAFFLHGGCACFMGVGEEFHHRLAPLSKPVVLIKPEGGVSTAAAYRAFDECPQAISEEDAARALAAQRAEDVPLLNNLVCASELLLPVLVDVRKWIIERNDIEDALMSGSGSAVFAVCRDFSAACRLVADARARGWWARATAFSAARAGIVPAGMR